MCPSPPRLAFSIVLQVTVLSVFGVLGIAAFAKFGWSLRHRPETSAGAVEDSLMNPRVARAADLLYRKAPALYRLLYRPYKVWTDRAELKLMRSIVTPGMTVVDVGANIGILTLELARLVGPKGRVYAFEPDPD